MAMKTTGAKAPHRSSIACISCLSSYTRTTKRYAGASVTISQAQSPSKSAETTAPMIRERRAPAPEGVTLDGRSAVISSCDYALAQVGGKANSWHDQGGVTVKPDERSQ